MCCKRTRRANETLCCDLSFSFFQASNCLITVHGTQRAAKIRTDGKAMGKHMVGGHRCCRDKRRGWDVMGEFNVELYFK